jgi:transposase-like protein
MLENQIQNNNRNNNQNNDQINNKINSINNSILLPEIKPEIKEQSTLQLQPQTTDKPKCPNCRKKRHIIRSGIRRNKHKDIQRYFCKLCNKIFSIEPLSNTSYPPQVILTAITHYNLGNTIEKTRVHLSRKFKTKIPQPTIQSWLKRYSNICTFTNTLRKRFTFDPNTIIHSKKFHHQQVYEFKYHTLKTNIAGKTFPQLKSYITSIYKKPYFIPESVFQHGPRCSELQINLKSEKTTKNNNAPKLAELAQTLAKTNRDRHQQIENTFLINDTATIAIEIPVYLKPEELSKQEQAIYGLNLTGPLSGHIDILQVRFNKIYILDFKPDAKRSDKSTAEQIFLYALALSKRTKTPLNKFICIHFNDKEYFQLLLYSTS